MLSAFLSFRLILSQRRFAFIQCKAEPQPEAWLADTSGATPHPHPLPSLRDGVSTHCRNDSTWRGRADYTNVDKWLLAEHQNPLLIGRWRFKMLPDVSSHDSFYWVLLSLKLRKFCPHFIVERGRRERGDRVRVKARKARWWWPLPDISIPRGKLIHNEFAKFITSKQWRVILMCFCTPRSVLTVKGKLPN